MNPLQKDEYTVSTRPKFDLYKAIEVLLYITNHVTDIYTTLKILYFADRDHLSKYGRLICDDSYVALQHGPVPSGCYDIIKYFRGDGFCPGGLELDDIFQVRGDREIEPLKEPNLDLLSESDIECLDHAIKKYGCLSFGKLRDLSHDKAFESADSNDFISFEDLARSLPEGEELLEYLENG